MRDGIEGRRTVQDEAEVIGRRGPLAREVKATVSALSLVDEHNLLAQLDRGPKLKLNHGGASLGMLALYVLRSPARKDET